MQHRASTGSRLLAFLRGTVVLGPLLGGTAYGIEQPTYQVLEEDGDFSIRRYAPYLVAETRVQGDFDEAGDTGFNRLFRYITGNNRPAARISMTVPVAQSAAGTDIAMTAPVAQASTADGYAVSFMLPSTYTLETAPEPLDPTVYIRAVPGEVLGVVRFSGFWREGSYAEQSARLREFLAKRGLVAVGEPRVARYDPPFTPPFLRRNEILIPVGDQAGAPGSPAERGSRLP